MRDVRLFLEGRHGDLARDLRARMEAASEEMRFEEAAGLRDLLATVEEIEERQKMAAAKGDDADIFGLLRRAAAGGASTSSTCATARSWTAASSSGKTSRSSTSRSSSPPLLKQIYLDQQYIPAAIHVPVDFEDREALEELLSEKRGRRVEIHTPQRGQKKALLDLVETNAKHSFDARFRVLKPSSRAIQEALQDALGLPEAPRRIECFDISHIQGTDKVASMVVWEDGRMKKSDYRKFIIRTVEGNDDFASMREVVDAALRAAAARRAQPMPGLVLIDGGLGQLHAAAEALEALGIVDQPLASIAKREEIIYVLRAGGRAGRARPLLADAAPDPVHPRRGAPLRRHLPPHAPQRAAADLGTGGHRGRGPRTVQKLLKHFGSPELVKAATDEELAETAGPAAARRIRQFYTPPEPATKEP